MALAHEDPETSASSAPLPMTASRATGPVLLVGGLLGAVAALVLIVEKIALLENPDYLPSCTIDVVLTCGSIMRSAQSEVLGFPNPVIGLMTFPVVAAVGALAPRTAVPGSCWLALQFGATAGVAFVGWLIAESVGAIGALCPYCMVVWAVTITIFWFVTAENLARGHLEAGALGRLIARHPGTTTAVSLLFVIGVVAASFPAWIAELLGL